MPHDCNPLWVLATGYAAERWREWLYRRGAPEMQLWAETRRETCPKRDISTVSYRLPSRLPPCEGDAGALADVFGFIRHRCDTLRRAA